ncbi:MAG: hypothetical protein IJK62_00325 [Bacteroidales bacterium]|nr:hypothetical protein [Bacteroidales bacterium]
MIWLILVAVYIVVNIILLFMLMYDDVQNGGSGIPGKHPVLFVVVLSGRKYRVQNQLKKLTLWQN